MPFDPGTLGKGAGRAGPVCKIGRRFDSPDPFQRYNSGIKVKLIDIGY